MKKISVLGAVAFCALALTSCAPSITVEQAKVEAQGIRARMEANGDYIAGPSLKLDYKINKEASSGDKVEREVEKGTLIFDLTNLYVKAVIEEEDYIKIPGAGEATESEKFEAEGYVSGEKDVYFTIKQYENNVLVDEDNTVFDLSNQDHYDAYFNSIDEMYSTVSTTFRTAVNMIFSIISYNDQILKQLGISLSSHGTGSLIITEDINVNGQKSHTVVEFAEYMLTKMESDVKMNQKGVDVHNYLIYTFEYKSYNKK